MMSLLVGGSSGARRLEHTELYQYRQLWHNMRKRTI